MSDKESIKKFLTSIAKDDYVGADKAFPDAVKSAYNNVINKRKPAILDAINTKATEMAKESAAPKP